MHQLQMIKLKKEINLLTEIIKIKKLKKKEESKKEKNTRKIKA